MACRQGVHAKPKPNGPIPDKQDGRNIGHWMPLDFFPLCRVLPRLHPAGKPVDDCLLRYRQMPLVFRLIRIEAIALLRAGGLAGVHSRPPKDALTLVGAKISACLAAAAFQAFILHEYVFGFFDLLFDQRPHAVLVC